MCNRCASERPRLSQRTTSQVWCKLMLAQSLDGASALWRPNARKCGKLRSKHVNDMSGNRACGRTSRKCQVVTTGTTDPGREFRDRSGDLLTWFEMRPGCDSGKIRAISADDLDWRASEWEGTCRPLRTVRCRTHVRTFNYTTILQVTRFTRVRITSARSRDVRHFTSTGNVIIACALHTAVAHATGLPSPTDYSSRSLLCPQGADHARP